MSGKNVTVAQLWGEFTKSVLGRDKPDTFQYFAMRASFYAGATAILSELRRTMSELSEDEISDDEIADWLNDRFVELYQFTMELEREFNEDFPCDH